MKGKGVLLFLMFIALMVFSFGSAAQSADVAALNATIQATGGKWVAGETSMSRLSPAEQARRLGLLRHASAPGGKVLAAPAPVVSLPASLDWRNNGGNYVTPIKDQGSCGSCWAFSATGTAESATLIASATPNTDLNLSEQVLVSCSGAGSCAGGYIDEASNYIRDTGLPLESCYPYTGTDGTCSLACSNWQASVYKIQDWSWVVPYGTTPTVNALKNGLYTHGPLAITMAVYSDFYNYVSGIYKYTSGYLAGYHAIILVGYNDAGQYFIVKNSWGTGWGEQGYFRIAYSELTSATQFGYETIAQIGIGGVKVTIVSGASYDGSAVAPESIATAFGSNLAITTGDTNTRVSVMDSAGIARDGYVFYASPSQVNFLIPPGTALGTANVSVTNGQGAVSTGSIQIASVAPGLFSQNADGKGVAAANILRIKADGTASWEALARYDTATAKWVSIPISVSAPGDQVFLILYGTGIRYRSSLQAVTVTLGGIQAEVLYAGAQGTYYVGLDQINVRVPTSLAGRGEVNIVLTADGKTTNTITFNVQ
jgi:uncharacterized protein (TIGR03437 family)